MYYTQLSVAFSSAYTPCVQRSFRDFRADDHDCRTFHICSLGRVVTMRCPAGGVFDERSLNCVPAHSYLDRCSSRQTSANNNNNNSNNKTPCPPGTKGRVPHPSQCTRYYDCEDSHNNIRSYTHGRVSRGWSQGERECPHPLVFSTGAGTCVQLQPGVCGARQEPLDPCDYKTNQCQGHSECVPCHVRFPSCRGRQDGLQAWAGRQGSPYYVVCQRQRVVSTGTCLQDGAVTIFDQESLRCVKKEDEEEKKPEVPGVEQTLPHGFPAHGLIPHLHPHPHPHQSNHLQRPNGSQLPGKSPQLSTGAPRHPGYLFPPVKETPQESRPQLPEMVRVPPQQQQQLQGAEGVVHVPYLRV